MTTRRGGALLAAAALVSCNGTEVVDVVVASSAGTVLAVTATVADSADERRVGLRGRVPLQPGEGLLLDFPVEGEVCIFNDGVDFAIDAIYASSDGTVAAVERGIPAGDESFRCHAQVELVLEVLAGEGDDVETGHRLDVL